MARQGGRLKSQSEHYIRAVLSIVPALAVIGIIFYILGSDKSEFLKDVLLILIGVLAGMAKEGNAYFMGSSQGSADKTDLLMGKINQAEAADDRQNKTGVDENTDKSASGGS